MTTTRTADQIKDATLRAIYLSRMSAQVGTGRYPVEGPSPVYSVVEWQAPKRGRAGRYAVSTNPQACDKVIARFLDGVRQS